MDIQAIYKPYTAEISALDEIGLINPNLAKAITRLIESNRNIRKQLRNLTEENKRLESENKRLNTENEQLNTQCCALFAELSELKGDYEYLEQGVTLLNDIVMHIRKEGNI